MNEQLELEYEKNIEKMKGFIKPNFSISISGLTELLAVLGIFVAVSLFVGIIMFFVECPSPTYYLKDLDYVGVFDWLHDYKSYFIEDDGLQIIFCNLFIYVGYLGAILYDWVFIFIEIFLLYKFKKFYDALLPEYQLVKFNKIGVVFWLFLIASIIAYIGQITDSVTLGVIAAICGIVCWVFGCIFFIWLSKKWSQFEAIKHLSYIWCIYFIGGHISIFLYFLALIDMESYDGGPLIIIYQIFDIILLLIFCSYIERKMCISVSERDIDVNSVKTVGQTQSETKEVKSEDVQANIEENNENDEDEEDYDDEELTEEEARYLEDVEFYLEEDGGVITPEARAILQRKCKRWGISEERANELEQLFSSASNTDYTDEEKEYIEIYQELSADGEITERKRRMLERERDLLGISQERAKELEENC